jgi:hypothetical protein
MTMLSIRRRALAALPCAAALFLAASCVGTHKLQDPTVVIQTGGGTELGVSTDYGVVFLGRSGSSGSVEVTAWFGDGPSIEPSVIEPIGGGLFTAETEIRLPSVPMTFLTPKPGEEVLVVGRHGSSRWEETLEVRSDPRVWGILLQVTGELRNHPDQVGAGVYVIPHGDENRKQLVGLVSGILRLDTNQGPREYLTVVGPEDLWRLVTYRRDRLRRKPWVYREDIL